MKLQLFEIEIKKINQHIYADITLFCFAYKYYHEINLIAQHSLITSIVQIYALLFDVYKNDNFQIWFQQFIQWFNKWLFCCFHVKQCHWEELNEICIIVEINNIDDSSSSSGSKKKRNCQNSWFLIFIRISASTHITRLCDKRGIWQRIYFSALFFFGNIISQYGNFTRQKLHDRKFHLTYDNHMVSLRRNFIWYHYTRTGISYGSFIHRQLCEYQTTLVRVMFGW